MEKKPKNIHLSEQAIETLTIMAIKDGSNFKNFIEDTLENFARSATAVKAVRQKGLK